MAQNVKIVRGGKTHYDKNTWNYREGDDGPFVLCGTFADFVSDNSVVIEFTDIIAEVTCDDCLTRYDQL